MEDKRLKLKPTLGLLDATAISVGAIIGAGIFVVTGIVAGMAGPALLISMVIAAAVSLLTALSFAELSAWLPREGSVYEFSYRLISPFAGFMAGWMWMLGNTFGGAAVSLGFAYYFTSLFPFLQPKLIAALLCLAFTVLNHIGIKRSATLNNLLVGSKLVILIFFVVLGLGYVKVGNFRPFIPSYEGILFGACYIFFAYGGFARVSVVAEEVKDAEHTVPRAILLSLLISTIFYRRGCGHRASGSGWALQLDLALIKGDKCNWQLYRSLPSHCRRPHGHWQCLAHVHTGSLARGLCNGSQKRSAQCFG
jgi:APA family basic amino acid/polyamine antiporter